MNTAARVILTLILSIFFVSSIANAEDLYLVRKGSVTTSEIIPLKGVNVYAFLEEGILVGMTTEGKENLLLTGLSSESVETIGERSKTSEYFFFQIRPGDIEKLSAGVEIVYFNGKEAVARVVGGSLIDPESTGLMFGLTHVSFNPLPLIEHEPVTPRYAPLTDPDIEAIVAEVTEAHYTAYIQRLQDFVTRYTHTDSCRSAEQWAVDTFASLGLETELWPYNYSGNTWYNPVGRKIGTVYPDSIYIIIGHIDATSEDPWNAAPGAEDNASGSACVLEAARVLSQYDFDCTIEFLLVSGEELGLIGSEAYAEYCYNTNRNLGGVFNYDMISYAGSYGWDTNIYSDQNFPAEVALADLLADLTDEYTDAYSIRVNTNGPMSGSDHYYFSLYGFPAPFSIDAQLWSAPDWYPWYHTTDDVIDHLDLPFGTEVVRGAVATLVTCATLSIDPVLVFDYPFGLPGLVNPDGGTSFRVEVTSGIADPEPGTGFLHYSTGGGFTEVPMVELTPNVYDAVFPSLECGVVVSYYLSAETVNDSVVTDPRNAPEVTYSAFSAYGLAVIYEDDFSTDKGWTGLGGIAEWTLGPAVGGTGDDTHGGPDPSVDNSPSSDNRVLGNDLTVGDGDYEPDIGNLNWVTSPVIDCSDNLGVTLEFYRWLGVEQNAYDHAALEAFNGTSWVTLFQNGGSTIDESSWNSKSYDVSAIADGNPDFQVRFGLGDTDGAWEYCGWNIDDMEVTGYSCTSGGAVSVDLVPDNNPTIVPPGGSFGMTAGVTNSGADPITTDIWFGAYRNNQWYQQRLYPNVPVNSGQTRQAHFSEFVPFFAPPGDYTYVEFCGEYNTWAVADSSFFTVTVTP